MISIGEHNRFTNKENETQHIQDLSNKEKPRQRVFIYIVCPEHLLSYFKSIFLSR